MNCETCDSLLIDLVERELDETRAAEVRAHAETCESCSRSLVRLEGGRRAARELMRAEPPRLDAVMAAARTRAAEDIRAAAATVESRTESTPATPSKDAPEKEESTWLDAALRWLGGWATGPQVAMAALLVLMVGIGVFNLPQFQSHPGDAAEGALVEPDVRAESSPSALAPAQPLDLAVDGQRVALGTGEGTHDERPTTTLATAETTTRDHEGERHAAAEAVVPTPEVDRDGLTELAVADLAPSETAGRVEDGPLPDVSGAAEQQAVVLAPSTATSSPVTTPRAPATPRTPSTYDEVEPPPASLADVMPPAIHRQARALAAAGRCDEAVPRYRTLLADHPDYADAPRAMIELADCDRRLGHLDEADRWLARAESFPSVSADARRARARILVERHAIERPAAVDSYAPTSAPTAAH